MKNETVEYREPKTYEEAVHVLKQSTKDNLTKDAMKSVCLRSGIVTAIGAAVALICGIKGAHIYTVEAISGLTLFVGGVMSLPAVAIMRQNHEINSGKVFEKMNEEETIKNAKHYVNTYREYIAQKKGGKKL